MTNPLAGKSFEEIQQITDSKVTTDLIERPWGNPVVVCFLQDAGDPSVGIFATEYTPAFESIDELKAYCLSKAGQAEIAKIMDEGYGDDWRE